MCKNLNGPLDRSTGIAAEITNTGSEVERLGMIASVATQFIPQPGLLTERQQSIQLLLHKYRLACAEGCVIRSHSTCSASQDLT